MSMASSQADSWSSALTKVVTCGEGDVFHKSLDDRKTSECDLDLIGGACQIFCVTGVVK